MTPEPTPGPEPVGAIAERVLTDLAHGRDPHLAARQHAALTRLARAHHKEQQP
ncbi:hypothetical protein [Micromonospora sp. DPT]|uniref:hypothetical protein n=1 Tax=Micromonospora sp. DPT TaxID=3142975 RepID=UPI003208B65D